MLTEQKDIIEAQDGHLSLQKKAAKGERATGFLLLVDIVNYGVQAKHVGDENSEFFLVEFVKQIKKLIDLHGGRFIKADGDAVIVFIKEILNFLDLVEDLRSQSKENNLSSFGIRGDIRMVAHYGRFRFDLTTERQFDMYGNEVIKIFRIEKIAGKHQVVVTKMVFELIKDDIMDRAIRSEFIGVRKFKSFEPISLYRLVFSDEGKSESNNILSWEKALQDIERQTEKIPVFGDFYPSIDMEKNFINLDIVREGDSLYSKVFKKDYSTKKEHRGAFESRNGDDKDEKRETIIEKTIKQNQTNATTLYEEYCQGIILGMPGSGKTTSLSYFAYKELKQNKQLKDIEKKRVVLFIKCREIMDFKDWYQLTHYDDWPPESIPEIDVILKYFTFNFVSKLNSPQPLTVNEIEELKKAEKNVIKAYNSGCLTLLIDALDECKNIEIKKNIVNFVKILLKSIHLSGKECNFDERCRVFLSARYFEKQEYFSGQDAHIFEPFFIVRDLNREQLRDLARCFYNNSPMLFKEFDDIVWQDESLIKVASTPLTALLVLAYFEYFKQLGSRYSLYNILITFILIRAWDQIKSNNFKKNVKDIKTFFIKARDRNIFQNPEYKDAGKVYDILSFLAYDFLAEKNKDERINEQAILGLFEKCKMNGNEWLYRFVEDHLLVKAGYDQYVFIHLTVMEYMAARFIVEKQKDVNFLSAIKYDIDLENVESDFFESEILPISVGSEEMIAFKILILFKDHIRKIENRREKSQLYYKTVFRTLCEFESFILRQKKAVQIKYLREETEKLLKENSVAIDWIYKYLKRMLLTNDKEKLKESIKEFDGTIKLSQPLFLNKYIIFEEFSAKDSEVELYRTKLLEQLIDQKHIDEWFEINEQKRNNRSELEEVEQNTSSFLSTVLQLNSIGYDREDKNFYYYQGSIGTQLKGFLGSPNLKHSKAVSCVNVYGNAIVSGSIDGTISCWDFQNGKEIFCIEAHSDGVINIKITEKSIITVGSNGVIKFWDKETAKKISGFDTRVEKLNVVAINEKHLVQGTKEGIVKIIDLENQREGKSIKAHESEIECVAISGNTIISGASDGSIHSWDLKTGLIKRSFKGHADAVKNILFIGEAFLSSAFDGTLKLWDLKSGTVLKKFEGNNERLICIAADGDKIVAGAADGFIKIWNMNTGKIIRSIKAHIFRINSLAIKDNIIISGSGDSSLKLWNIDNGKEIMSFKRYHKERVNSVTISNKCIISASDDNTIKVWDMNENKEITMKGHLMNVCSVFATPDIIISGAANGDIKIWDMETKREIRTLKGHKTWVNSLTLMDDKVISGSHDKTIRLWDLNTGKEIDTLKGHVGRVNCLKAIDGFIVSGASSGEIKIWNIENRNEVDSFQAHPLAISDLVVRKKQIVSASFDNTLKLWFQGNHNCLRTFEGHTQPINCVEIIGEYHIISGANDRTLKLWDIHNGQCIKTIKLNWIPLDIESSPENPCNIVTANANGTLTFFDFSNILNTVNYSSKSANTEVL